MQSMIVGYFRGQGFAVDAFSQGQAALAASATTAYDVIILDLGLPDIDGMHVLRLLGKESGIRPPVLVVTARDRVEDRIGGLDAGADDYILKPFDLAELEARVRAVLRRPGNRGKPSYKFGDVTFDPVSKMADVDGRVMELSRREISVLEALIRAAGRIVVKDSLEERLYGFDQQVSSNAIEAAISRLRKKLAGAGSCVNVDVVRGIGYRLACGVSP